MIQLIPRTLSEDCLNALAGYQAEIDALEAYAERVEKAKAIWPSRKQNQPFEEVAEKLGEMCVGVKRCCYCEDSTADEIEHIWPKDFYPEKTFVWENYLYACGPCNGRKRNKFAIFTSPQRMRVDVHDPLNGPWIASPQGDPLLIDPRQEDPLEYLFLDLADTFEFTPLANEAAEERYIRADYTCTVLRLNLRVDLVRRRKLAYSRYKEKVNTYVSRREAGVPQSILDIIIEELRLEDHPTVWKEIVRYRNNGWLSRVDADLDALFDRAPEALLW